MRFVKFLAAAGAAAMLIGAAYAQAPGLPANRTPDAVRAGTYAVEPIHTRVLFSVSHMGFTTWYGDFTGVRGTLVLDPEHPAAARLDVILPIASVSTTNAKLDAELKGPAWFDAAKFPMAHFVSRKVTLKGSGRADVAGDLTLHGVTRPIILHVTFNGAGINPLDKAYTVGFEVRGAIHRSAFGVSKYVPLVGDKVDLIISGAFERKST
ncbi:MAG: YceI family protein [Methylovirgula sp.]